MRSRSATLLGAGVLLVTGMACSVCDESDCAGDIHAGVVELGRMHFGLRESPRLPENWRRGTGPLIPYSQVVGGSAGSSDAPRWLPSISGCWFETPVDFDFDGDGTSDVVGIDHAHCECLFGPRGCGRVLIVSGRTHGLLLAHRVETPIQPVEICGDYDNSGTQDLLVDEGDGDFVVLGER